MTRGAISCGEAFSGDNEGCSVGSKVEEELGDDVECEEGLAREEMVCEANGDKDAGEDDEAHDLNGFAAYGVDCCDCDPVACYLLEMAPKHVLLNSYRELHPHKL